MSATPIDSTAPDDSAATSTDLALAKLMSGDAQDSGVTLGCTDMHNAERFVALHGQDARFVSVWGKWIVWDGQRWQVAGVLHFAKDTARVIAGEAQEALDKAERRLALSDVETLPPKDGSSMGEVVGKTLSPPEKRANNKAKAAADADMAKAKKMVRWATESQMVARLNAMVEIAKSSLTIDHATLDADPWILTVENGAIDLKTGQLREHRRDDFCTKLASVTFDAGAKCPTWDTFLARAMGGDVELVGFLARLIGYGLTGDVSEHVVAFHYGAGANGKSTFLGTINRMLGDYAAPAPRGLLFRARGERHPTELASLAGRRFVTCSEIEEGQAFDEALLKDLTGGDVISARRMREDFWSFAPTHKLSLAGNHKPTVRGDDEGVWRRMRLVPWLVTIPREERDTDLPGKLAAELPGILAWAVRGCLAWQCLARQSQSSGLGEPASVLSATATYRSENDTLGEFLRFHVTFEPGSAIARKDLREAYTEFCRDNGSEPFGAKRFAGRLRGRGATETTVRNASNKPVDAWRGVRLATDSERVANATWQTDRAAP